MKRKVKHMKWPEANGYTDLCDIVMETPESVAYEYEGKKVTYGQLLEKVNRVSNGLNKVNIKSGDKVIVSLPDIPQAIECFYAFDKCGIFSYTLHPDMREAAIAAIAEELHASVIVTVNAHYEEMAKAVAGLDHPVQIILADVEHKKTKGRHRLFRRKAKNKYAGDEYITPWSKIVG